MRDNLRLITPLLNFETEDDFYYLQILQRKKENGGLGSNSRIIKNYYIGSVGYLENKYAEIKSLCYEFNARAYIRLNKRSYEKVAFKTLINNANTISNKDFINVSRNYDRAVGQSSNQKTDKRWIIDLDNIGMEADIIIDRIINAVNNTEPIVNKIKTVIPTKSGFHIISNPFNLQEFSKYSFNVEIHKDNPTNLFIP